MKKSETSLNNPFNKRILKQIFNLPMLILIILFTIVYFTYTFFDIYGYSYIGSGIEYSLFQQLRAAAEEITMGDDGFYFYSLAYNQTAFCELLFGALFALVNFDFLLNKKKLYTHLSFATRRSSLYAQKTILPLICGVVIIISIKFISALANGIYLGVTSNLVRGFIASTLTSIMMLFMGYAVTVIAHLFTGRRIEAYTFMVSAITLPYAIEFMVKNIFVARLNGYTNEAYMFETATNEINQFFRIINPTNNLLDITKSGEYIPVKIFTSFKDEYIECGLWLCVFIAALILCGKYFSEKYKPENVETKAKSKIVTIISSVSIPLVFVQQINWVSTYTVRNSEEVSIIVMVMSILLVTAVAVIISMLITRSAKASLWGAIGGGAIGILQVICLIIAVTGCFGFSTKIPDKEDIASVTVNLPFADMTQEEINRFFYTYEYTEGILIDEAEDFDIVRNIHKAVLEESEDKSAVAFDVTYTLKNGKEINRQFEYISENAAMEFANIWKTEAVQLKLKVLLNQADDAAYKKHNISSSYSSSTINPELYDGWYTGSGDSSDSEDLVFAIEPQSVILISKDMQITPLSTITKDENALPEFSKERTLELMGAIYKDAQALSAEEWFAPEKELGALAFCEYRYDNVDANTFQLFRCFDAVFYINSNMKNTLAVLDKYDYTKYFECKKNVVAAHFVDVNDVSEWMQAKDYYSSDYTFQTGLHGTYFSQNNNEISTYMSRGCNYDNINIFSVDGEIKEVIIPESEYIENEEGYKLTTQEEITDLNYAKNAVKDAYMSYNVGNHGKFLVVKFADGTQAMLVVPESSQ